MYSKSGVAISHLNCKSSVLCPENNNIINQYLALERIGAHHRMVSQAKGCVDTSAPKSLRSYISYLDRKKKSLWLQQDYARYHRPASVSGSLLGSKRISKSTDFSVQSSNEEEDRQYSNNLKATSKGIQAEIPFPSYNGKVADKISWYLEALHHDELLAQKAGSHSYLTDHFHRYRSQNSLSSSTHSNKKVKGDILDSHKNCFTNSQRSFTPRILANNNAKSKVRDMRCYNPPRKKKQESISENSSLFESYNDENGYSDEFEDEEEDTDHENDVSVKESDSLQSKVHHKVKRKNSSRVNSTDEPDMLGKSHMLNEYIKKAHAVNIAHNFHKEDKYLKFLNDVTEDILRSGVYSDRAIQRAFEFHLQFYQKDAEKNHLKQLLNQILENLRMHDEDGESEEFFRKHTVISSLKCSDVIFGSSPPEKEHLEFLTNQVEKLTIENPTLTENFSSSHKSVNSDIPCSESSTVLTPSSELS